VSWKTDTMKTVSGLLTPLGLALMIQIRGNTHYTTVQPLFKYQMWKRVSNWCDLSVLVSSVEGSGRPVIDLSTRPLSGYI
jgi:hypothetical protein